MHLVGSWPGWSCFNSFHRLLPAELLYGDRDGVFIFEKQAKITTKTADGVVSAAHPAAAAAAVLHLSQLSGMSDPDFCSLTIPLVLSCRSSG